MANIIECRVGEMNVLVRRHTAFFFHADTLDVD